MSPNVEAEILAFLREQRDADIGGTLSHLADMYVAHELKDTERHSEMLGTLRGHSLRIGELEKDADKLEHEIDATGKYRLDDLQERAKWGKRFLANTVVGLAIAVVSGIIGAILAAWKK